jgi:hypothetical protein
MQKHQLGFIATAMVVATLGITCIGCGHSDEWSEKRQKVYKSTGTLLLDGKPCADATVTFFSDVHQISATGRTDSEGRFKLTTYVEGDGAVEGGQKITVVKREFTQQKTKFDSADEPSVAMIPKELLPKKYMTPTTSGIAQSVSASGSNDFKIEIASK